MHILFLILYGYVLKYKIGTYNSIVYNIVAYKKYDC